MLDRRLTGVKLELIDVASGMSRSPRWQASLITPGPDEPSNGFPHGRQFAASASSLGTTVEVIRYRPSVGCRDGPSADENGSGTNDFSFFRFQTLCCVEWMTPARKG
jgi:hypothetical protein